MSTDTILHIIQSHPEGIWIRELARLAEVSPATVCNRIYGYRSANGKYHKPALRNLVTIERMGDGALTLIKPK